jgi:hypothetical protein
MSTSTDSAVSKPAGTMPLVVLAWLWVAVPFGYGLYQLLIKIPALFSG